MLHRITSCRCFSRCLNRLPSLPVLPVALAEHAPSLSLMLALILFLFFDHHHALTSRNPRIPPTACSKLAARPFPWYTAAWTISKQSRTSLLVLCAQRLPVEQLIRMVRSMSSLTVPVSREELPVWISVRLIGTM